MADHAIADRIAAAADERALHEYKVPEKLGSRYGVRSIAVVELTGEEEILASKRAHDDRYRLANELAKQSLAQVNGQRVSLSDGSTDRWWRQMGPKVRTLVIQAYADVHAPDEGDTSGFLASRETKV